MTPATTALLLWAAAHLHACSARYRHPSWLSSVPFSSSSSVNSSTSNSSTSSNSTSTGEQSVSNGVSASDSSQSPHSPSNQTEHTSRAAASTILTAATPGPVTVSLAWVGSMVSASSQAGLLDGPGSAPRHASMVSVCCVCEGTHVFTLCECCVSG